MRMGWLRKRLSCQCCPRDEEPEVTTQESMFSYVRLSDGGPARHQGPRSEVAILSELAARVVGDRGPIHWSEWSHTGTIRQAIGAVVPGWEQIGTIDKTKQEFFIPGRRLNTPVFPTASGRARFHAHQLPALSGENGELRLMTVRSEGQFNTVVYEDYDLYRGQDRRDLVLVHSEDLARLGIQPESRVTIRSAVGVMTGVLARSYDKIKPGNVLMYYPEANVLVPRTVDPQSRTPAFKNVLVRMEPAARNTHSISSSASRWSVPGARQAGITCGPAKTSAGGPRNLRGISPQAPQVGNSGRFVSESPTPSQRPGPPPQKF